MDATWGRALWCIAAVALAVQLTGCGLLGQQDIDNSVRGTLSNPTLPVSHTRGQAPPMPLELPPETPQPASASIVPQVGVAPQPLVGSAGASPTGAVTPVNSTSGSAMLDKINGTPKLQVKSVATIGADIIVTDEEVSMMVKQRARDYVLLTGEARPAKEKEVYREELRKIVERELLLNDIVSRIKKNKPGLLEQFWDQARRMTDENLRASRKQYNLKSESEFISELERQGMNYKLFRRQIEREMALQQMLPTLLREKNGVPTVGEVQAHYEQHKDDYKTKDRVKFQHYFAGHAKFKTLEETGKYAEESWKLVMGGADFTKVVAERGHGDSALREGVGVGEARGEIRPAELEETVFSTKAGHMSGLVPTKAGYHFVKVLERDIAGHRKLDDKLQSEIRNKLTLQGAKAERDKLVQSLWRSTGVTFDAP